MQHNQSPITIVGAGLVGSLLSIYLAKRGYPVNIYERRPDMRKHLISAGKSINLALSDRGWKALQGVGLESAIREIAIPMRGRMIHESDGTLHLLPYGKEDQAIYSVSRGGLNYKLMDLAGEHENVQFHFNERCTGIDLKKNTVHFENTETNKTSSIHSELTFGTDGAYSALRQQVQLSTDRFNYSQFYIPHGYKELSIPQHANGDWAMEKNALHIWPRGQFMLIALPNLDRSFTCTLFFPFEGDYSFASLDTKEKMLRFFRHTFPDVVALMPTLEHDYFNNPTSSLITVKCFPWSVEDKLLLLGDAAHGIVPFFGQGMNAGFEDCRILDELIEGTTGTKEDHWMNIFREFEVLRKPDADAIADLALINFIEMRDLVAHPDFVLRKKIEAWFSTKHPDQWMPLYSLVTFSPHIRYSEALRKGKQQDAIMNKIMAIQGIENKWNSKEIENKILAELR